MDNVRIIRGFAIGLVGVVTSLALGTPPARGAVGAWPDPGPGFPIGQECAVDGATVPVGSGTTVPVDRATVPLDSGTPWSAAALATGAAGGLVGAGVVRAASQRLGRRDPSGAEGFHFGGRAPSWSGSACDGLRTPPASGSLHDADRGGSRTTEVLRL